MEKGGSWETCYGNTVSQSIDLMTSSAIRAADLSNLEPSEMTHTATVSTKEVAGDDITTKYRTKSSTRESHLKVSKNLLLTA